MRSVPCSEAIEDDHSILFVIFHLNGAHCVYGGLWLLDTDIFPLHMYQILYKSLLKVEVLGRPSTFYRCKIG